MAIISSIEPQKKRDDRFNIYVDGKFTFAASAITVINDHLKENQEIDQQTIDRLVKENEYGLLLEKTLRWLGVRQRSEKELVDYLHKPNPKATKPKSEQAIAMVIKRIDELGYINDEEFARWFAQSRTRSRPRGKRLLALELRQKGIDQHIIEAVLSESISEDESHTSEVDLAIKVFDKNLRKYKNLPKREFYTKMGASLARRGFDWETIKAVIDQYYQKEVQ